MQLDTDKMLAEKDGPIGWMTFNNPERRNAVSLEMWQAAGVILEDFEADDAIQVIVMKGAGDKAFVSGADISQFEANRGDAAAAAEYSKVTEGARRRLGTLSKPVVAMIRGYCLGGGLGVAMAADVRIASDDAKFGIPAANLGQVYGSENLLRLVSLVGPAVAKDILMSARRLDADEALRVGLVSQVVAPEALEQTVRDYATLVSEKAPISVRGSKAIINELMKPESLRDPAMIEDWVKRAFDSEDYVEGRRAFMEKRKPVFRNR